MKSICILSQNHLCRNPRVLKEALLFDSLGHQIIILTVWYSDELLQQDKALIQNTDIQYKAYADLRHGKINGLIHRINFKILRNITRFSGIEFKGTAGYAPASLLQEALNINPDIFIAHQEIPTLIGNILTQKGFKVAYDFEDWYSHDLLPEDRKFRPNKMLETGEKKALQKNVWVTTTSNVLADALHEFSGGKKPETIYNGFSLKERKKFVPSVQKLSDKLRFVWISQTIGPGRGLEEAITFILQTGIQAEIHLAGNPRPDYREALISELKNSDKITLIWHPVMKPGEICAWLNKFDIGLATDLPVSESRDLTITNKILHYLLAGLPILASNTKGHLEIQKACIESVMLMQDPQQTAELFTSWSENPDLWQKVRNQAWQDGEKYSWEIQSEKLTHLMNTCLKA